MRIVRHSRAASALCLWLWIFGPLTGVSGLLHADHGIDPCDVGAVAHDAAQHRVSGTAGHAAGDGVHCHACHSPRMHVEARSVAIGICPTLRVVADSTVTSIVRLVDRNLPPRSPPPASV
ncbi:MAG: hypothetical protein U0Q12_07670 [Vicinamibacterales bacterium]